MHKAASAAWLPVLKRLLCFAAAATAWLSLAASAHQFIALRAFSGLATGGIVTIALSTVGDRYPYNVQGQPMGKMFGAIAAGMGFGVSLGPILSAVVGWRCVLRIIAALFILAAISPTSRIRNDPGHGSCFPSTNTGASYRLPVE